LLPLPLPRPLLALLALLLAVACLVAPASAQVRTRDHRRSDDKEPPEEETVQAKRGKKTAPIGVAGFAPAQGGVGTVVVVRGSGFAAQTSILIGGRQVKPQRLTREEIHFVVPARVGDGTIVLRHPGLANDLVVGRFELVADPLIQSFAPISGVPGTRVEIRGTGFRAGDEVRIDQQVLRIDQQGAQRIVVVIPAGATTGALVVKRPGGAESRSRQVFRVALPAPTIANFTPASGPAGTRVRLTGASFTPRTQARYGRMPLTVDAVTETTLDVIIPTKAGGDQMFTVRTEHGEGHSQARFHFEEPPIVTRFAPPFGVVGQRIDLFGANFQAGDVVTLGERKLKILQLRDEQISVEVPAGAVSGALAVARGSLEVVAQGAFEVVYAPTVNGFSPSGGEAGARVTIAGTHFTAQADVYYGPAKLRILERTDAALVVAVPPRLGDRPFTVRTRGGEAQSTAAFEVYTYSIVRGASPQSGAAGTRVTLTGQDFRTPDRFFLGELELAVAERERDRVVVTIPPTATTGTLSWESYGRRFPSRLTFAVVVPPVFADFSPQLGPPGTIVVVKGENFTKQTAVLLGNARLQVTMQTLPGQLQVRIPKDARGTEYLWVEDAGARIKSKVPFQITLPPMLRSFAPERGKPGVEVTLAGADFTGATQVLLGDKPVDIVRRQLPSALIVRIPADAAVGSHALTVQDGPMTAAGKRPFQVLAPATITGVTPARAKIGEQVDLAGAGFGPETAILLADTPCQILRWGRKGELITIRVPEGATGRFALFTEEHGQRRRQAIELEVVAAAGTETVPAKRGTKKP
jgi:hypothetical protein